MAESSFLIIEDERALALAIAATVRKCGGQPEIAGTLAQGRRFLSQNAYCGLIIDIGLPDGNGLSLLESIPQEKRPPAILVTAHGEIENAIAARKLGVREFFDKPIDFESFSSAIQTLLRSRPIRKAAPSQDVTFIGGAESMRAVFQKIAHACASSEPVLIIGETGTGKSKTALLISQHGESGTGTVTRDAYTAAEIGEVFDRAEKNDVLILDPITRLDAAAQAVLGAAMEGESPLRVVATAPTQLINLAGSGAFSSDLFYRLQVLEIRLPRLNQRLADIPVLVSYFLGKLDPTLHLAVSDAFLSSLRRHDWPGNLRELRNVVTYAYTLGKGALELDPSHLPEYFGQKRDLPGPENGDEELSAAIDRWMGDTASLPTYRELSGNLERILIVNLLKRFQGKLAPMAATLQANRATLRKKLSEFPAQED